MATPAPQPPDRAREDDLKFKYQRLLRILQNDTLNLIDLMDPSKRQNVIENYVKTYNFDFGNFLKQLLEPLESMIQEYRSNNTLGEVQTDLASLGIAVDLSSIAAYLQTNAASLRIDWIKMNVALEGTPQYLFVLFNWIDTLKAATPEQIGEMDVDKAIHFLALSYANRAFNASINSPSTQQDRYPEITVLANMGLITREDFAPQETQRSVADDIHAKVPNLPAKSATIDQAQIDMVFSNATYQNWAENYLSSIRGSKYFFGGGAKTEQTERYRKLQRLIGFGLVDVEKLNLSEEEKAELAKVPNLGDDFWPKNL